MMLNATLASRSDNNDTIDLVVLGDLKNNEALQGYQVVHFQRFDLVHKRAEATVKAGDGKEFKVTNGAPQVILGLSANAVQVKPAVEKAVNEFAARLSFVGRGAGSVLLYNSESNAGGWATEARGGTCSSSVWR